MLIHLSVGALATPLYIGSPTPHPTVSYGCIQLVYLSGGALPCILTSDHLRRRRSFPPGAGTWCNFREGPCHASLHRHAHATWGRLIPDNQFVPLLGKAPTMLTYIGTSPLSQAVSYWSTTWFISPVRPCHAYATSRGLLSTHHVVSHEMGPCYASLHRQCARHI